MPYRVFGKIGYALNDEFKEILRAFRYFHESPDCEPREHKQHDKNKQHEPCDDNGKAHVDAEYFERFRKYADFQPALPPL
jgi:hypothetical protein